MALCTGPQAALWRLGGVPEEHRTDSLSAALHNLAAEQDLTRRNDDLCRHYGMRASRCNAGQSNENGSMECVAKRLADERMVLQPLPARRTAEYEEIPARVSKYGLFTVKAMQYSAPRGWARVTS